MKPHISSILGLALLSSLFSCRKEKVETPPTSYSAQLAQLHQDHRNSLKETYTIDASTGGSFTTTDGSFFDFGPGSFKDASGTTISSGIVELTVIDVYEPKDMILGNLPTQTHDGRILVTGGEFFMEAKQNGEVLTTVPGNFYIRTSPTYFQAGIMFHFDGIDEEEEFNWYLMDTTINATQDTNCYILYPPNPFQWLNCDAFYGQNTPRTLTVNLTNDVYYANTMVAIHLPSMNGAMRIYGNFDSQSESINLPDGIPIDVVIVHASESDGFKYEIHSISSFISDRTITADPQPGTLTDLESILDGL